ncbi:MAG: TIGR04283 family arsenosugar biosynthesis glycosyltransferase [Nitrospira sp.]|nr:TIGR04283 family arsenosugar biosynthesis glycosyltransferase [Nitrospira sp.]
MVSCGAADHMRPSCPMTIAVIIPVLNEARCIEHTLADTAALGFDDLVIVDGGSTDATCAIVHSMAGPNRSASEHTPAPARIRLLATSPGRAHQLNAGAAATRCDILLFLHADTQLPTNARQAVSSALSDQSCVGGRFNVRFDSPCLTARLIARLMNLRSRLSGIATGDQAIFVRRDVFERIGKFAEIPLMEDIEFTGRLKRAGPVAPLSDTVVTAFRRWERNGPLRTILLMWTLRLLYWIGMSPHRLQHFYGIVR